MYKQSSVSYGYGRDLFHHQYDEDPPFFFLTFSNRLTPRQILFPNPVGRFFPLCRIRDIGRSLVFPVFSPLPDNVCGLTPLSSEVPFPLPVCETPSNVTLPPFPFSLFPSETSQFILPLGRKVCGEKTFYLFISFFERDIPFLPHSGVSSLFLPIDRGPFPRMSLFGNSSFFVEGVDVCHFSVAPLRISILPLPSPSSWGRVPFLFPFVVFPPPGSPSLYDARFFFLCRGPPEFFFPCKLFLRISVPLHLGPLCDGSFLLFLSPSSLFFLQGPEDNAPPFYATSSLPPRIRIVLFPFSFP